MKNKDQALNSHHFHTYLNTPSPFTSSLTHIPPPKLLFPTLSVFYSIKHWSVKRHHPTPIHLQSLQSIRFYPHALPFLPPRSLIPQPSSLSSYILLLPPAVHHLSEFISIRCGLCKWTNKCSDAFMVLKSKNIKSNNINKMSNLAGKPSGLWESFPINTMKSTYLFL